MYKEIILSTLLTEKIRWHYRLLDSPNRNIKYITFPLLAKQIEDNNNYSSSLIRLKKQHEFINKCDCVVLGCTHYNIIKDDILDELVKYNFNGVILDSNEILVKYYNKFCIILYQSRIHTAFLLTTLQLIPKGHLIGVHIFVYGLNGAHLFLHAKQALISLY